VLQRVSGVDESALLDILREGVARRILVEDAGQGEGHDEQERFRFRHALTRDAIDGELLARERRLLHRRVAETLEALLQAEMRSGAMAGSLATHFSLGGDLARAQPYAVAAAEHALLVGALSEAAEHLARAAAALPEDDPASVPLLELQGRVRVALLEVPRAAELLWKARTTAKAAGMRWHAAAIGSELAFLTWFADPAASDREWVALLDEAEARAQSDEPEDEPALRLYSAAAMCCGSNDANQAALAWADRAIALAGRLGQSAERQLFRAYVGRGMARVDTGAFDQGIEDLRHAIDLGLRYADPHLALAYNVLIKALTEIGRDERALAVFAEASEFERRTGAVVSPPPVLYAYLASGRWDEGMAVATAQLEGYASFGIPTTPQGLAMAGLGHFLLRRGRPREALLQFEGAWERLWAVRDFAWAANCLWGRATALAALGRTAEARETLEQCIGWWVRTEDRGTGIQVLLDAVHLAAAAGDPMAAERWTRGLERMAATGNPVARAAFEQAKGQVALLRGEPDAAAQPLREALQTWERLGRPFDAARAMRALAEALLAGPRSQNARAEADQFLTEAVRRFTALGAAEAGATGEIRRRAGLEGQARRKETMEAARSQAAGLTRRELEVLQCLAEGKTNREIAATLFIAEGTAELHVSRILGKLKCATRAQAAALAVSLGLAAPAGPE
jgi:DNA-binding CsgD family transcriptional regulator